MLFFFLSSVGSHSNAKNVPLERYTYTLGQVYEASLAAGSVGASQLLYVKLNAAGFVIGAPIMVGLHVINVADFVEEFASHYTGHKPVIGPYNQQNPLLYPARIVRAVLDNLASPRYFNEQQFHSFLEGRNSMSAYLKNINALVSAFSLSHMYYGPSVPKGAIVPATNKAQSGAMVIRCPSALQPPQTQFQLSELARGRRVVAGHMMAFPSVRLHLVNALMPQSSDDLSRIGYVQMPNQLAAESVRVLAMENVFIAGIVMTSDKSQLVVPLAHALLESGLPDYNPDDIKVASLIEVGVRTAKAQNQFADFVYLLLKDNWDEAVEFINSHASTSDRDRLADLGFDVGYSFNIDQVFRTVDFDFQSQYNGNADGSVLRARPEAPPREPMMVNIQRQVPSDRGGPVGRAQGDRNRGMTLDFDDVKL